MRGLCTAVFYLHPIRQHFQFMKPSGALQHTPFYCAELKYDSNHSSSYIPEIFHFIPLYLQKKSHFEN